MNLRYDEEADVLYVQFPDTKPIHNSELTDDDFLIEHDADGNVVGLTILDVSQRWSDQIGVREAVLSKNSLINK